MSAIYGKLNFDGRPVNVEDLSPIESALNHWNADDKGMWHRDKTGLGHLMLYNTPESLHEKLPLHDAKNQLTITADARIDNRDELFNKLGLKHEEAGLIPDSTLILKTYEKYGDDCVKHLIGDFSFAIWDENQQKLFCARDQMGIRPFFYYKDEYFFAFATEARGLLAITGLNKQISEEYFLKLIANIDIQKKETAYKHIFRLEVAHTLTVKNTTTRFNKYWELDAKKEIFYEDKSQYLEKFRELFTEAIRCRVRSNYLIGTELSGGLDSSGIASLAASMLHAQNKKIAAFVNVLGPKEIYEDENERDELYADEVIAFAAIDYIKKSVKNPVELDFIQETDDLLSVYGYPCKATIDWNRNIYKKASAMRIRTILSGHGGDQLVTDRNKSYILDYFNTGQYKTYFKLAIRQWGIKQALLNCIKTNTKQHVPAIINKLILSKKKTADDG